ncbi:hypothetical protein ZIOFF_018931 [Zingiber officinale]|uniref:Uncharacterized protein n=1 Tax=Zingiber officinale TaxID=94328 RepID=A0A8J5HH40_ZINOF|nr:hypothetical protein ZIOFF_018931 [Zingiber officinale]
MVLRRSCWSTLEGSVVSTASFSFSNYFPCLLVGTCSPPLFNFSSHGIVMMAGVGLDACCHSAHAGARLKNQIFFFKHVLRRSEILEEVIKLCYRRHELKNGNEINSACNTSRFTTKKHISYVKLPIQFCIKECEEALVLNPSFRRARQRLASLLIRKLQAVERQLDMCAEARKVGDWKSALK